MDNKSFDRVKVEDLEPVDEKAQRLEEELAEQRDARKAERFIWALIVVILFNAFFAQHMDGIAVAAVILLQLPLLIILGQHTEMEEIKNLVERYLDKRADDKN